VTSQEVILMQNETRLNLIRSDNPGAFRLLFKDRRFYYATKRVIDVVLASVLLVLLFPMMLLIALVIVLYSPGPVFFVQERVGAVRRSRGKYSYWEKVTFPCYKFRTMRIDADPTIHQAFFQAFIENNQERMDAMQGHKSEVRKLVRDPRITRPGKLLRKLSLDELPQLWNVLRGDMSLVGPRPAIPYEVEMYSPWHLRRLDAQPGITGLQQVTARSTADFDRQVELDIEYIDNQSLWLDFKIILKTPLVVVSARGAE